MFFYKCEIWECLVVLMMVLWKVRFWKVNLMVFWCWFVSFILFSILWSELINCLGIDFVNCCWIKFLIKKWMLYSFLIFLIFSLRIMIFICLSWMSFLFDSVFRVLWIGEWLLLKLVVIWFLDKIFLGCRVLLMMCSFNL